MNMSTQFDRFIFALAEKLEFEIKSAGSITLKREDVNRGIEPDNCYYIQTEPTVREQELDLETDPPPDLAIEIDITSTSVNKFGIYLALGVPELWRYNGRDLKILSASRGNMLSVSLALPFPSIGD